MSDPGFKRYELDDGRIAKVPLAKLAQWQERMRARGETFRPVGDDDGDPDAGLPEPRQIEPSEIDASGQLREPMPAQPDPAFVTYQAPPAPPAARQAAARTLREQAEAVPPSVDLRPLDFGAFLRGGRSTASFGLDDEAAGFGSWLAGRVIGQGDVPRTAGRGVDAPAVDVTDYEASRDLERAALAKAEQESPASTAAGKVAGIGLTAALPVGRAARAATALGRARQAALVGAPIGALAGFGASEGETPSQVIADTATGATLGAAVPAGASLTASGLRAAAPIVKRAGLRARTAALAPTPKALERAAPRYADVIDKTRPDPDRAFAEWLGGEIERMGIDRRPKVPLVPSTPRVYKQQAAAAMDKAGPQVGEAIGEGIEQGVKVSRASVLSALTKLETAARTGVMGGRKFTPEAGGALQRFSRRIERAKDFVRKNFDDEVTAGDLHDLKKMYEEEGFGLAKDRKSVAADAARKIATVPRAALHSAMEKQAAPETFGKFLSANKDYRAASAVSELANAPGVTTSGQNIADTLRRNATQLGAHDVLADAAAGTARTLDTTGAALSPLAARPQPLAQAAARAGEGIVPAEDDEARARRQLEFEMALAEREERDRQLREAREAQLRGRQ